MLPRPEILFLAHDSPWPAHNGSNLRSLGLLKELSKRYRIDLIILSQEPLSAEQTGELSSYAQTIQHIHQLDASLSGKILNISHSILNRIPYHAAMLERSFQKKPALLEKIWHYPGLVFTSTGHWGCLVRNQPAKNWILNQCDADVEFWRVYATQTTNIFMRLAALLTYFFSKKMYPLIYANVGCVISVCEEDKQLTEALCPSARVEVIENGVDCTYFAPEYVEHAGVPRLLFTGTSVARNMLALRRFAMHVLPLISQKIPEVELLVAGRFSEQAQITFRAFPNIKFTGPVSDIRPFFNQSDVFIAPFEETHGSKLKISEAMAMALPIVSTPQGIRGFPLVAGQSVLISHNNEQFADHVGDLLNNPSKQQKLGTAARELAENTLDWNFLGIRLQKIIADVQAEII